MSTLLSIVIPTRNRASYLKELLDDLITALDIIDINDQVEVCCVDNFSTDNTRDVVETINVSQNNIRYFMQSENWPTAEQSMSSAVLFAKGKYVWTLGDDDRVTPDAIARLVAVITDTQFSPQFILINAEILDFDRKIKVDYFEPVGANLLYQSGMNLFKDFGFISHTTTISCLCFNREIFLSNDWALYHRTSPIYSHSFGIFSVFKDHAALFMRTPIVHFRMSNATQEKLNHTRFQQSMRNNSFRSFHTGLLDLIRLTSVRTGIPLTWFAEVQELEFDKFQMLRSPALLPAFILRALVLQTKEILTNSIGNESLSNKEIEEAKVFFDLTPLKQPARLLLKTVRSVPTRGLFYELYVRLCIYHIEKFVDNFVLEYRMRSNDSYHTHALNRLASQNAMSLFTLLARITLIIKAIGLFRLIVRTVVMIFYMKPATMLFTFRSLASLGNSSKVSSL